ncbi:MAG: HK97 gp10 family phage protein [Spirochaetales bacterium]|jgi:HK97 gp10 family phage protein|nr:HK97 gp10 family phage protein [Spirochaetales bacterium]
MSVDAVKTAIKDASEKMVLEMAIKLANQAKLLAPVNYGQLRNSISVATADQTGIRLNDRPSEKQAPPLKQDGLKELEAYTGSNVEHATHQEYGTKFQRAQPFLQPAREIVVDGANAAEVMKRYNDVAMSKNGVVKK